MKLFDKIKEKRAAKQEVDNEKAFVDGVYSLFEEYRSAYASEWERLETCERMYRSDHWYGVEKKDKNEPQPVTPIIQSTIENVHADLMDNIPEAIIQPEGPEDERVARVVEALIKQNHDAASYAKEYWLLAHDLLTCGYMVQETGYDTKLNRGLGGAFIRHVDTRNIMFDPQVTDAQDSRAVIKYASKPVRWMEQHYPEYAGQFKADTTSGYTAQDGTVKRDDLKNILLLEYWWREYDTEAKRYKVHMCKVGGGKLLEDSRKEKPDGYFAHGEYPFKVTPLYVRKGSCLGYGIVDMFIQQQKYSDKLDQIVMKNALMASRVKMLVRADAGDIEDLRDWSKEVHEVTNLEGIKWFSTPSLPSYIMQYIQQIRQSIKDESGANDFSRGTTSGGVTAASAVAALQEMSGKRSRMATRQMHEAFKEAVRQEIEVEREFNILPREVMLTTNGQRERETFDTAMLQRKTALGNEVPMEFLVSIKVQKENRWAVMAHNELMIQMLQLGALQPMQALELMQFEGKESVLAKQQQQPQMSPEQQQAQQAQAAQQEMAAQLEQIPSPEMALG
ncbi:MAG TPA: hypothetical protein PKB13_01120 [Clostridia bacterium]|nr:hypothetical protein [Clostridia bacterium]